MSPGKYGPSCIVVRILPLVYRWGPLPVSNAPLAPRSPRPCHEHPGAVLPMFHRDLPHLHPSVLTFRRLLLGFYIE